MKTKSKLVILELIGGLFGWAWIIASLFVLYYIVMAVGFHGHWSKALLAFVIGAVSKWMAKGFKDNQQRVSFEADLIEKGYTPHEAGKMWISRYLKNG